MKGKVVILSFFLLFGVSLLRASDTLTIYQIQYTTDPSGDSPYKGDTVTTYGIVTGTYTNTGVKGFSLEEQPGGAWHGIFVYTGGAPSVTTGDSIRITAVVDEYRGSHGTWTYGRTELKNAAITILKHNSALPGPTLLSTGEASQEMYEGVFIRVEYAVCESLPNQYNEWVVNDGTGPLRIDDLGVTYHPSLGTRYNIQGFLDQSYDDYKLEPRVLSDIEEITGNLPPEIEEVTYSPLLPDRGDSLTVRAIITDDHLVLRESLFVSTDSMQSWLSKGPESVSGDTFTFAIEPQAVGTNLFFYVFAMDDSEAVTVSDTFYVPYLNFQGIIPIGYLHILDDQGLSIFYGMGGIKVRGVVTVAGELGRTYYIQDTTGGVALYDISGFMKRGDTVVVTGFVDNFYGLVEIKNGSVLERVSGAEPSPDTLTCHELTGGGERYEGVLVHVNSVTTSASMLMGAITIHDSTGSFTVYIDNDSELYGRPAPEDTFNITGVVSQHVVGPPYFGGYQIVPRTSEDIVAEGNGSGTLTFNPPYLLQGESLDLTFRVTAGLESMRALRVFFPVELNWSYDTSDIIRYKGGRFEGATLYVDSLSGFVTISSFVLDSLETDSFTLKGVSVTSDTLGTLGLTLKTSTSGFVGDLRETIKKPKIYVTLPIEKVQTPGPDGYASQLEGDSVTVGGVVTGPSSTFSPSGMTSLWIQDRTGGVNVFYSGGTLPLELGDVISALGTVTEYNGVTEVSVASDQDIKLIGENSPQPEPYLMKVSEDLREDLEGRLLRLENVQVASPPAQQGSGKAFQVWNGQIPINVYVYNNAGIDLSNIRVGKVVDTLIGIAGQYDPDPPYTSGYQFLPRVTEDISVVESLPSEPQPKLILEVLSGTGEAQKKVFAPSLGEVMEISATGPSDSRYTLKVFDSKGRNVRTFYENTGTPFVVQWKGDDNSGRRLPLGMYIVQLKAKLPSGKDKVKNTLIVIAAPLK